MKFQSGLRTELNSFQNELHSECNSVYMNPDGTFAGTGRLPGQDVCRDGTFFIPGSTLCKVSIISSWQSGMECLHDKNCPAFAGIPVEGTGTKNVPANILSI